MTSNDDVKLMAANAAIRDMYRRGWVDICTVRKIVELLRCVPDGEAMRILETLHCVSFMAMPAELMRAMPELLERVFGGIQIEAPQFGKPVIVEPPGETPKRRLFGLLRGNE